MVNRMSGKQSSDYFKKYYQKNKERISKRNKELYQKRRSTEDGIVEHRRKSLEYTKKYREKNREKIRAYSRKRHRERKIAALEIISKGRVECANCGCDDVNILEINHINGGGCKEHKAIGKSLRDSILNGSRNIDDLNVLCRVCNAADFVARKFPDLKDLFKIKYTGKKAILESNGKTYEELKNVQTS